MVLVRHGQTTWLAEDRFQGSADPPLTVLGQAQAAAVARRLAGSRAHPGTPLPGHQPRRIWHSPLDRAAATAGAIGSAFNGAVPLAADDGLRELAQGDWEGRTHAEVRQRWSTELAAWRADPAHHHAPGGESLDHAGTRAAAAVDLILGDVGAPLGGLNSEAAADQSPVLGYAAGGAGTSTRPSDGAPEPWVIVVAHDGILRLVLLHLLGMSRDHYWSLPFGLCSITVVEIRAGRARLRAHNLADHLPQ